MAVNLHDIGLGNRYDIQAQSKNEKLDKVDYQNVKLLWLKGHWGQWKDDLQNGRK